MAEYIEREKTVERLRSLGNREYRKEKGTIQDAIKMISYPEYTPAADVAPVVRCKDCKHYRNYQNGLCYLHTEPKTNARGYSGDAVCVEPDDFCSYGEKKDGGDAEG